MRKTNLITATLSVVHKHLLYNCVVHKQTNSTYETSKEQISDCH